MSKRRPSKSILIVGEGEKTERIYFYDIKRIEGLKSLEYVPQKLPMTIVNKAISRQEIEIANESPIDYVFCVFDRDQHSCFEAAIQKLNEFNRKYPLNKIELIITNPCFEFWMLLHYKYTTTQFVTKTGNTAKKQIMDVLKKLDPFFENWKENTPVYEHLNQYRPIAIKNSRNLRKNHNSEPSENPFTNVDHIFEALFPSLKNQT